MALYLHMPFCRRRCSYCDFNAYQETGEAAQEAYLGALLQDVALEGRRERFLVETIFFGGGTPSLAPPGHLEQVLQACGAAFELVEGLEVTMEANPGTLRPRQLVGLRGAGINRISFGVQAFQDRLLAAIDRVHTGAEADRAVAQAREAGFTNLNLDLIYGLPGQTREDWLESLDRALALGPEHLSAYALILEEGTPLKARVERGQVTLPDEDEVAWMAAALRRRLRGAGYRQYEISNWSRPGLECRHNRAYWRNGPYLGLGCGAVSYLRGWRTRRILHPTFYQAALAAGRWPVIEAERLGREATLKDTLILGLRTRWGVHLGRLAREYGLPGPDPLIDFFEQLPGGLARRRGPRVVLTQRGRDLANEVFVRLLDTALTFGPRSPAEG